MTVEATHQTDENEAAAAIEQIAQEAEYTEEAEQAQADPGEWEDGQQGEEQARAVAAMMVQGVEFAAGMIHPGHQLDSAHRQHGEEVMLPVARDFAGEVPEWLQPYMHYLGAGLWLGGVMFGAYKARRAEDAERARETQAERGGEAQADGV